MMSVKRISESQEFRTEANIMSTVSSTICEYLVQVLKPNLDLIVTEDLPEARVDVGISSKE
jgi:hypothetical protein